MDSREPSPLWLEAYAACAGNRDDMWDWLEARNKALTEIVARAKYVAEHLHAMVPREVWREHGAEWQGFYEGDYHAEQVQREIESWAAPAP